MNQNLFKIYNVTSKTSLETISIENIADNLDPSALIKDFKENNNHHLPDDFQ